MKAMILAAGRGERMRPLTDTTPKPMLCVHNKPLIVWHIEALSQVGIKEFVINYAWLGQVIEAGLGDGSRWGVKIVYSPESQALETAGGIATALPLLTQNTMPNEPFFVINGDVFCPQFQYNSVLQQGQQLANSADLAHLYLVTNPLHHPQGDFYLAEHRVLDQVGSQVPPPPCYTFGGIAIYKPSLFAGQPANTKAALAPLLRQAMRQQLVGGQLLSCPWTDVGTPERLAQLNAQENHHELTK